RIELHPGGTENALAPIEEAELRLRIIVAVQQRIIPAVILSAPLELEAAEGHVLLVEAVPRGQGEVAERLVRDARCVVGPGRVEAAVETGIRQVTDRERVRAEQVVGLPEQNVEEAAAVELCGVLRADVGAAAAFHTVPARKLVDAEQIAV